MNASTQFEDRWLQGVEFRLAEKGQVTGLCPLAQDFARYCESTLEKVRQAPSEVSLNIAHLQLQAQYWARYETAPAAHKNHIGIRNRHTCLFQVYRRYYLELRDLLLSVNPPLLREPLPPPPAPLPPQIAGVPFGITKREGGT